MLWLCCRLAAIAPVRPLAWEPPYAVGAATRSPLTEAKKENQPWIQSLAWELLYLREWPEKENKQTKTTKNTANFMCVAAIQKLLI